MEVVWCRICEKNREPCCLDDYASNYLGCNVCGLVLRTDDFGDPESPPKQHPVHTCAQNLGISDQYAIEDAMVCHKEASGHFECRPTILAAICLYIGCRANDIPIMLFDLSIDMRVSVYYVGLMFLDVCEFLTDQIHGFRPPKIVDPVFFVHRFTMIKENNNFNVLLTALRILAAIKSDYVGRRKRLAGLCAAAVYMAANFNGLDVDNAFQPISIHKLVKCTSILEFSCLAHVFRSFAEEYDKFLNGQEDYIDVLCPHNVEMFCHGFCHVCYNKFVTLSVYFGGGSDEQAMKLTNSRNCPPTTDLENGIAVPRQDDRNKTLSSIINFDALCQVFGDDVAQSTKESNGSSSNAMEQGQARKEIWGDELANGDDAQGRQDSPNKDDQREELLANKVRRRFGQPKRPWIGLQK